MKKVQEILSEEQRLTTLQELREIIIGQEPFTMPKTDLRFRRLDGTAPVIYARVWFEDLCKYLESDDTEIRARALRAIIDWLPRPKIDWLTTLLLIKLTQMLPQKQLHIFETILTVAPEYPLVKSLLAREIFEVVSRSRVAREYQIDEKILETVFTWFPPDPVKFAFKFPWEYANNYWLLRAKHRLIKLIAKQFSVCSSFSYYHGRKKLTEFFNNEERAWRYATNKLPSDVLLIISAVSEIAADYNKLNRPL